MFLDRDGVLNKVVFRAGVLGSPRDPAELEIVPEAAAALSQLRAAGFLLVCVTNQPEVARGELRIDRLEAINAVIRRQLPLDDLLVCCHQDADGCHCRKPKPGMLLEAAGRHNIDLQASFMVGDRWRDVEAGAAAGCRTAFLDGGYEDRAPAVAPNATVSSLDAAVAWILAENGQRAC